MSTDFVSEGHQWREAGVPLARRRHRRRERARRRGRAGVRAVEHRVQSDRRSVRCAAARPAGTVGRGMAVRRRPDRAGDPQAGRGALRRAGRRHRVCPRRQPVGCADPGIRTWCRALAAELVFAVFLYRVWNLPVAVLSGAAAGLALAINDLILWYPGSASTFSAIYVVSGVVSRRCHRGRAVVVRGPWSGENRRAVALPVRQSGVAPRPDGDERGVAARPAGSRSRRRDGTGATPAARSGH